LEQRLGLGANPQEYGGRTVFLAKVKQIGKGKNPQFVYELLPPEKGSSDRLRRRYGSHAFIRVSFGGQMSEGLFRFFLRPLIILDKVYRAFRRKDDNVFFVLTNEAVDVDTYGAVQIREPTFEEASKSEIMSYFDFVHVVNDLETNRSNVILANISTSTSSNPKCRLRLNGHRALI
jgi:hypothetical protein